MKKKEKKKPEFFVAPMDHVLTLSKKFDDFTLCFTFDAVDEVKRPKLFIRKSDGKGVLQLNSCVYFPVEIPEELKVDFANCKSVEIVMNTSEDENIERMFVPVSRVLKFPVIYDLIMEADPLIVRHIADATLIRRLSRKKEEEQPEIEKKRTECDEAPYELSFNRLAHLPDNNSELVVGTTPMKHRSCRKVLEQWVNEHEGFSLETKTYRSVSIHFLTDNHSKAFLIYAFDCAGNWLTCEDILCESCPEYYSQAGQSMESPTFVAAAVADYLYCHTGLKIQPIVMIGDTAKMIDVEDMCTNWASKRIVICRTCSAFDDGLADFSSTMVERLKKKNGYSKKQIVLLNEVFKDLTFRPQMELLQVAMRHYSLAQQRRYCDSSTDVIFTWLKENYSECITIGSFCYLDLKNNFTFYLIYNFSNVAIFLQADSGVKKNDATLYEECLDMILEKFKSCGIQAALTPCVITTKQRVKGLPSNIKCLNAKDLFELEKVSFHRKMEFGKCATMSRDDVRALIQFTDETFCHENAKQPEKYSPEAELALKTIIPEIEQHYRNEKLIFLYDTCSYIHSRWILVIQKKRVKTTIIFRSIDAVGDESPENLERVQNEFQNECDFLNENAPWGTEYEMIVIVPEKLTINIDDEDPYQYTPVYTSVARLKDVIIEKISETL